MKKRVIVVGAGAAGLMAAITAAKNGAAVTLLEGMDRPGKKLLLTGNGRCNLTNMEETLPDAYYGTGASLAASVIRRFDASGVRGFFAGLGLLTQEKNGYVYPYTAQAASVLEVLLTEVRRQGIKLKLGEKIEAVSKTRDGWAARTATWSYEADAVILGCGSQALPSTGSDGSGYLLAKGLGHSIVPAAPALAPLICEAPFLSSLSGVRCRARAALYKKDREGAVLLKEESGELQWTKYGVSGIVIFQLSRFVSAARPGEQLWLCLDLLPEFEAEMLTELLCRRAEELKEERVTLLLAGALGEKLIPVVLKRAGTAPGARCGMLKREQIRRIVDTAKKFELKVKGTKSFDVCQVCSGGVDCREVSDQLESLKQKGIYFAGEILDVDGPCGGYNLQWAWSSGYVAGMAAAAWEKGELYGFKNQ